MNPKHGVLAAVLVLAMPLTAAAVAFACGSLATLKLNRSAAVAGTQVTAVGGNYNSSPRASAVQIRFNSRNGRVLWEGRPSANGRITGAFAVPDARPGYYVIVATQTGPDGRPAAGTPGRAPLRLRRAASSAAASGASAWTAPPGGTRPASPAGGPAAPATVAFGVLAVGLLGGALVLVRRGRQRRARFDVVRSVS